MPRGGPDWGVITGPAPTGGDIAIAELAVRTGALPSIDRLGQVVFVNGFEGNLAPFETGLGGTGAAAALSAARARNGSNSLLLTGGSDGDRRADFTRRMPLAVVSRLGVELSFILPGTIDYWYLQLIHFDGANANTYAVAWDDANDRLMRLSSDSTFPLPLTSFTSFATGINLFAAASMWHDAKLVLDLITGRYVRFRLNNVTYDLSAFSAVVAVNAALPRLEWFFLLRSRSTFNDQIYVDDFILTQNEP